MDLTVLNNTLSLVRRIIDTRSSTKPIVDTVPDKPAFVREPVAAPFPRATPEEKGVPSALLEDYYRTLRDHRELDMHSVLVMRDGAVIAEADFGAYDRSVWHISFSQCKSVTGLAIGMLVDEGLLDIDEPVLKIFGSRAPILAQLTMKDLRVRHLLTMTSGVSFSEPGALTETDWVRAFFESKVSGSPGEKFSYNSLNTYMLSAIVHEITGMGLTEYLRPRLWEPLEISSVYWEKCPMGIEKGGWGLYLRPEDFMKIGQLVLNKGCWNGRQLVSESWVRAATSVQSIAPESCGDYNYGFQIWVGRKQHSFLFNGMFGQNLLCFPDTGLMVCATAGNDDMFQQSPFFQITQEMLGIPFGEHLPPDPDAHKKLTELLDSLDAKKAGLGTAARSRRATPAQCAMLEGTGYRVVSTNAPSLGLLPITMQATQNLYAKGLVGLSFFREGGVFCMRVEEEDESHTLPIGFLSPAYTQLDCHGEPHLVGTLGRFARDEDERLVLILRVSFLEAAGARHIRLYFEHGFRSLECRWEETPGLAFAQNQLQAMTADKKLPAAMANLLLKTDADYVDFKLLSVFTPKFKAVLED